LPFFPSKIAPTASSLEAKLVAMSNNSFARLLGAYAQVPGVSRVHVRALEVPHEGADQIVAVMNLAGWQVLEPRPCRVNEV
jgi:hypothetical protein